MRSSPQFTTVRSAPAFSLVEMAAVLAILGTLMAAGMSFLSHNGAQSCKAGTEMLTGLIEHARTKAITSRSCVVLAIAEPGDLSADDGSCRIGLFKIEEWPDSSSSSLALTGVLLKRWQTLETGIVLAGGDVDGVANPLDEEQVTIRYRGADVKLHIIAFNPCGGLRYPTGSTPAVMRIAEGHYRNGKAFSKPSGGSEYRLKIGRVTARPYRTDG